VENHKSETSGNVVV